ncbi:ACT domain-containing protein, partial [Thermodesulfobacteriota bacterium]
FSTHDSNVVEANVTTPGDSVAQGFFKISVKDIHQLTRIIADLRKLEGVQKVERLGL